MRSRRNRLLSEIAWWEWVLLLALGAVLMLGPSFLTDYFGRDAQVFGWGLIAGIVVGTVLERIKRKRGWDHG